MDKVKCKVTMTKAQAKELEKYSQHLIDSYKSGFYNYEIKCCLRDFTKLPLFWSVLSCAFGWFSSTNVPYACVYELANAFVDEILKKHGY